jgi:hypothetical protein
MIPTSLLFQKLCFIFLVTTLPVAHACAQGKYAGSMKKLMGVVYEDARKIPALKGWQYSQGTLISSVDDPAAIGVDVFQKGTTAVVLMGVQDGNHTSRFRAADVLEIKNITRGWVIKTGTCRVGQNDDVEIVALAKDTKSEVHKVIRQAWRCRRDKYLIEITDSKNITCLNEGAEQF